MNLKENIYLLGCIYQPREPLPGNQAEHGPVHSQRQLLHLVQGSGLEQLPHRNVKRFRGGLVFKAHRWLYHSTLGSRVIKKKNQAERGAVHAKRQLLHLVQGSGFRFSSDHVGAVHSQRQLAGRSYT